MRFTIQSSVWLVLLAGCGRISFDAAADSGPDAVTRFCGTVTPGYVLCTDFDSGAVTDGFTLPETADVGTIGVTTTAESLPNALSTTIGMQSGTTELSYADLALDAVNPSSIELRTSLYLPQRPTAAYEINSLNVTMTSVGSFYNDLEINPSGSDDYRQEYLDASMMLHVLRSMIPQLSTGTWHHVIQKLDIANQTYEITIDSSVVASGACMYPIIPGMTQIQVGANFVQGPINGAGIYQDNVVLYIR